jgi:hypothetical protein
LASHFTPEQSFLIRLATFWFSSATDSGRVMLSGDNLVNIAKVAIAHLHFLVGMRAVGYVVSLYQVARFKMLTVDT